MSSNYMRVSHGLAIAAWGPRPAGADGREIFKSAATSRRHACITLGCSPPSGAASCGNPTAQLGTCPRPAMRSDATSQGRMAWAGIAAHSESTPTRLWIIIPVMPIIAARPLLRSALSFQVLPRMSSSSPTSQPFL